MGNSYCVYGWARTTRVSNEHATVIATGSGYEYLELYRGESIVRALWTAIKARSKYGCVKVEMR